jgi:hypothetical protein
MGLVTFLGRGRGPQGTHSQSLRQVFYFDHKNVPKPHLIDPYVNARGLLLASRADPDDVLYCSASLVFCGAKKSNFLKLSRLTNFLEWQYQPGSQELDQVVDSSYLSSKFQHHRVLQTHVVLWYRPSVGSKKYFGL